MAVSQKSSKPLTFLSWSLVLTVVLTGAIVIAIFWLGARTQSDNEWVLHTLGVRNQLAELSNLVLRAEGSQRGYLLTGRDAYLKPYEAAVPRVPVVLDKMAGLVGDNPRQVEAVSSLRRLVTDKLAELDKVIVAAKAGDRDTALAIVNTDEGRRLTSDFRDHVSAMEAEENRLLETRQASAAASALLLQAGAGAAFLLICIVGALLGYFSRRSFSELTATRDRLAESNRALLEQIDQREQVEHQLRQSQKIQAIGELTGGIAHDFNNMLSVITASLDLMQRRIDQGDLGIERLIAASKRASERATTLTQRLLAFARQQPLSPEPIDANKSIASMSDLLRSTLGEQIRIETVSAAGLWKSNADLHQLESTILNVAINARDAMPQGGKLTIETGNAYLDDAYCRQNIEVEPGQYVMVAISDTGTGMPPDVVARVFDPFFTTKPAGKGTGLGLSQVYGFIKQSRGHIKLYSELGAGTTVKIYLPRLIGEAERAAPPLPQQAVGSRSGETILVVEDDALVRQTTIEGLRELGYTVVGGETANEALSLLDTMPEIKLLFTDVVMPEVNGKQLADMALRIRPDLKVLFTTGYTRNAVVHGGVLDAGVNLLSKPFTLEQLGAKLRSMLDA